MTGAGNSSPALGKLGAALRHEATGGLPGGWLGAALGAAGPLVRAAGSCATETLGVGADLARAMGCAAEEVQAALPSADEARHLAALVARTGDLGRSTACLWAESGLKAQERLTRLTRSAWGERPPAAAWLPRALLLAAVAADIYAGYASLRARQRRWSDLIRPRDWELQHARGASHALDTAASLGGVLVKACQFASARPDLLPAAYIETLAALQDRAPPRPWPDIERAIARELGRPPEQVFRAVDRRPVAAASLAQVHRAWLRGAGGREVAIKVQYPEIRDLVAADLQALGCVVDAIACLEPAVRLQPILDHLRTTLPLELDFRREARAMSDLRAALAHRDDLVVPEVVDELSTERLLVTDFAHGIKITERAGLQRAGIDPRAVARLLIDVYAEQIFRLGRLHADPHPGNLLVQPGPRLVLLDHGLSVELSRPTVRALAAMVRALADGDFGALGAALAAAGIPMDESSDVTSLLQLAGVLLGGQPTGATPDLGRRAGRAIGDLPVELVTVGRALGLRDGISRGLDPDLDVVDIVSRYT
jgi:predicted unusual protein kinase regulating ubiquinone biosynthesis (AarF/ABC1/UbiB family)